MSNLLTQEPPLQVLPSLAVAIGLNEAIVLQQVHYLLNYATTTKDDKKWVYNNYDAWQAKHFRFWSVETVKRTFNSLRNKGLLLCEKLRKNERNQTNFYTVNYDAVAKLNLVQIDTIDKFKTTRSNRSICTERTSQNDLISSGQNDPMLQQSTNRLQTTECVQKGVSHTGGNICQSNQEQNPALQQTKPQQASKPQGQPLQQATAKQGVGTTTANNKATTVANTTTAKQRITPITQWQAPDLGIMQHRLSELGYAQQLTAQQYNAMFAKFINYYADKESQGMIMGDAVKLDKWASWIMRERTTTPNSTPHSDITTTATQSLAPAGYKFNNAPKSHEQIMAENIKKRIELHAKAIAHGGSPLPLRLIPKEIEIYENYYGVSFDYAMTVPYQNLSKIHTKSIGANS